MDERWLNSQRSAFKHLFGLLGPYDFYYPFNNNRVAVDADYWTSAGDNGGFDHVFGDDEHIARKLYADTGLNDDWYVHGNGDKNKIWTPNSSEYSKVTAEWYLQMNTIVNTQAFFGLVDADPLNLILQYGEPNISSAIFFIDDGVRANFSCRTRDAAEEESDSGVAMAFDEWHLFVIEWEVASVVFKIDGTIVATHTTQVPAVPCMTMKIIRTEIALEEKGLEIEYVKVTVE